MASSRFNISWSYFNYISCHGICGYSSYPKVKYCSCDKKCIEFGDCCYDFSTYCFKKLNLYKLIKKGAGNFQVQKRNHVPPNLADFIVQFALKTRHLHSNFELDATKECLPVAWDRYAKVTNCLHRNNNSTAQNKVKHCT